MSSSNDRQTAPCASEGEGTAPAGRRRWRIFGCADRRPRRSLGRLRRDDRGAVAVESAIILPVFITVMMGTLEFGMLFFTYNTMRSAVRDVGRQVSINFIPTGQAQDAVRAVVPTWSREAVDVTVTESAPGDPDQNIITVRATLLASRATPMTFLVNTAGDFTLESEVQMRQEPPL